MTPEEKLQSLYLDSYSEMLETSTKIEFGIIPLLEDLQGKHPEFAEESVFRALEEMRETRDALDEIWRGIDETKKSIKESSPVTTIPSFVIARNIQSALSIAQKDCDEATFKWVESSLKFVAGTCGVDLETI